VKFKILKSPLNRPIKKPNRINKNRTELKYFGSVFGTQFTKIENRKPEKKPEPNRNTECPPLY
ncbi:hypothetical protein, partial [Klebsiella pneumoniae]|uniref:hypothetical protein n=1 Tax=Klebsiella pneumoniae TaxID=573 RepID=UPI003A859263